MKKIRSASLIILCAALFFGCKKEDQDSSISLKTRKGKLCERWVMVAGNLGFEVRQPNTVPNGQSIQFDGSNGVVHNTYNTAYFNMKYSLSIEFDKKGRFTVAENLDGDQFNATGRWDFGHGVGDRKKKQDIYIQLESVTTGDSQEHFFNHFSPEVSYDIEKISADVLRMHAFTNYYMIGTGEKGIIESTFTFHRN